MQKILEPVKEYLPLLSSGGRVLIVLAGGYLLSRLLRRVLRVMKGSAVGAMVSKGQVHDVELEKRANTVVSVIERPALMLLWAAVLLMALEELGFRIEPLLAGAGVSAGVIGVAVGFGAQTFIKDIIAGAFIIFENQIRVNDVAVINGTGGLVEQLNLRTTVLRAENGAVHIFQNGSIQTLSNLTREFAFHVLEIAVPFEEDTNRVIAILRAAAEELRADPDYAPLILDKLDVMGLDRFLPAGVVVKAKLKTMPQRQWLVGRELNRRVQRALTAAGIPQPSQINLLRLENEGALVGSTEQLKSAVRDVLKEMGGPGAPQKS